MYRAFWEQNPRKLLYKYRVDDCRRDGRVAQHMLFDTGRIDDIAIQVEQSFAVRKIERRVRVYLTPDKHVLGRQTDLFVPVSDIRSDGVHDLVLWQVDLWIQIGNAKFASP